MINKIEQKINHQLNKIPGIKKHIKKAYQLMMYIISPKTKYIGKIHRITPKDEYEYFYGYYDTTPWDRDDRFILCLRVKDTTQSPAPLSPADIILIDTDRNNKIRVISQTRTWNIQQGAMLQWLGPDSRDEIIYNDFIDGKYCSIIFNIENNNFRKINLPIYSVSSNGKFALTLDFSRLHSLRPGYGYSNLEDETRGKLIPENGAIWYIDLTSNKSFVILDYNTLYNFESRPEMKNATHKVNHIMISPDNKRFMFIHRWQKNNRKYSRLLTANIDGSGLYNLSDVDMVSHCFWKNKKEIIGYMTKTEGNGYYLLTDLSERYRKVLPDLVTDGHPSYSLDGNLIVTDTYPDRKRMSHIFLIDEKGPQKIVSVFSPFKYDNEFRCDLHPRLNREGNKVCFDSVYEGKRSLYYVNLREE